MGTLSGHHRTHPSRSRTCNAGRGAQLVFWSLLLAACAPSAPPAGESAPRASMAADEAAAATGLKALFVDHDWQVEASTAVAAGTVYRFGADGDLRIGSPGSVPAHGTWRFEHGALIMVEEGIAYRADILRLDALHFVIRSHNPGRPVDIEMVRADAPTSGTGRR